LIDIPVQEGELEMAPCPMPIDKQFWAQTYILLSLLVCISTYSMPIDNRFGSWLWGVHPLCPDGCTC